MCVPASTSLNHGLSLGLGAICIHGKWRKQLPHIEILGGCAVYCEGVGRSCRSSKEAGCASSPFQIA